MNIIPVHGDSAFIPQIYNLDKDYFDWPWSLEQWKDSFSSSKSRCFLMLDEDLQPQGFSLYQLGFDENEAHLYKILIHPDFRRRGTGKTLMQKGEEMLRVQGVNSIYLEVETSNAAAVKLYQSLGYETLCVKKKFYSNGNDAFAMLLKI